MNRRRVAEAYESAYPEPIRVSEGDELTIEERATKWEGWLWCIDTTGREGWIPDAYVERRDGRWIGLEDYVARELTVELGDTLASHVTVAGWEWCEKPTGETGWVPSENLRSI
ncbi:SH3 domain-containing protein [Haladaptatus salinisoli]|uniref:SH3 domain-containing protein n=1 Tax=Haladaptatus salinisoli TaxID=2884876 RepID=UPI001D0A1F52|nr:SH3 domain-containing protein [Haladaptatus salinisoli]